MTSYQLIWLLICLLLDKNNDQKKEDQIGFQYSIKSSNLFPRLLLFFTKKRQFTFPLNYLYIIFLSTLKDFCNCYNYITTFYLFCQFFSFYLNIYFQSIQLLTLLKNTLQKISNKLFFLLLCIPIFFYSCKNNKAPF